MRPYVPTDYDEVASWYVAHGQVPPGESLLPPAGLIEPGVAAGFLYRTDSALCLIEGVIVNPAAGKREQAKALSEIIDGLLSQARGLAIGLCRTRGMARRAIRHGMRAAGSYQLLSKEVA